MRMAGSLPLLPQRLIVRGETLKISATSRTVSKSGRSSSLSDLLMVGIFVTLGNSLQFKVS